jgi:N-acetylmuramoyl-L-alanine amidase
LSTDVLWYHASYVAPSWGRRLSVDQKIGAHIFYRS